jgi:hypothetical protein
MRYGLLMNRAMRWYGNLTRRMIALCVSLSFFILIAVSGSHLVHHLDDLSAGHPHAHSHTARPIDCLVLSLMQHIPLVGDSFVSLPLSLPIAEQVSYRPLLQTTATIRPTLQARSPPAIDCA